MNHQKCWKTMKKNDKNIEKIIKNVENQGYYRQKYRKIIKNVEKHKEKPSKLSKNHQKC